MLRYSAMPSAGKTIPVLLLLLEGLAVAQKPVQAERRHRAAAAFKDGIVLLHARSEMNIAADAFRQDPLFYYFTGLENTVGALLAVDGRSDESWLFLPSEPPYRAYGLQPEAQPGSESEKKLAMEHVLDWSQMEDFFSSRASPKTILYYAADSSRMVELPSNLVGTKASGAPVWLGVILQRWPALSAKDATEQLDELLAVQTAEEAEHLRRAAKATVTALKAGMRAIRPEISEREVEVAAEQACWKAGANGVSFWPWAMAGQNAVFPTPFYSLTRYDHLNRRMRPGELVRLDVGCEWEHYGGDLGRTVPVSGHYDDAQRETWATFVAAYQAAAKVLRDGVTVDQVFDAWRAELLRYRETAKSELARHAIDSWSDRHNIPFWQIHTSNLLAAASPNPLRSGTTINFEPIASVDGQGFFLEDMYLITRDGAELLTPGVPYSAADIEAAMK